MTYILLMQNEAIKCYNRFKKRGDYMRWIWQKTDWPKFKWNSEELLPLLSKARLEQGKLLAQAQGLGFELGQEATLDILIEEVVKTSEIEGEQLNRDAVRSSVAKHLGIPTFGLPQSTRSIDGLVEILLNATRKHDHPLTDERLKSWQAALFPTGYSGLLRIQVGDWRRGEDPMQVVSGGMGKEVVHFEAVPSLSVTKEMEQFLLWWKNSLNQVDGLLRAGLAHFYFITIHPFEDGNGRIARALTDMALAQDEKIPTRFYSLSSQIMKEKNQYYEVLERCQRGDLDITNWLAWFLASYVRSLKNSTDLLARILAKASFWQYFNQVTFSDRQRKVINALLNIGKGNFQGGLTTRKYSSIAKVSRATAFREITDLLEKNVILENSGKGRSVSYDLNWNTCQK
jgi:Fic family protein